MERMPRWKMAEKLMMEIQECFCTLSEAIAYKTRGRFNKDFSISTDNTNGLYIFTGPEKYPYDIEKLRQLKEGIERVVSAARKLSELFGYLEEFKFGINGSDNFLVKWDYNTLKVKVGFGYKAGDLLQGAGVTTWNDLISKFWEPKLKRTEERIAFLEEPISSYAEIKQPVRRTPAKKKAPKILKEAVNV